jgi:hypothetical protein
MGYKSFLASLVINYLLRIAPQAPGIQAFLPQDHLSSKIKYSLKTYIVLLFDKIIDKKSRLPV